MVKTAGFVVSLALMSVFSLPVLAQDPPAAAAPAPVATVKTDSGVIMVSNGGPFVTAVPGEQVAPDTRIMVSDKSAATVVYNDGCQHTYKTAGVYKVEATCKAAAVAGTNNGWQAVAVGIGAVATAGVAYGIYCENHNSSCSGSAPSH